MVDERTVIFYGLSGEPVPYLSAPAAGSSFSLVNPGPPTTFATAWVDGSDYAYVSLTKATNPAFNGQGAVNRLDALRPEGYNGLLWFEFQLRYKMDSLYQGTHAEFFFGLDNYGPYDDRLAHGDYFLMQNLADSSFLGSEPMIMTPAVDTVYHNVAWRYTPDQFSFLDPGVLEGLLFGESGGGVWSYAQSKRADLTVSEFSLVVGYDYVEPLSPAQGYWGVLLSSS